LAWPTFFESDILFVREDGSATDLVELLLPKNLTGGKASEIDRRNCEDCVAPHVKKGIMC
jgi:hypothetical protein